jgi:hypothetical protein
MTSPPDGHQAFIFTYARTTAREITCGKVQLHVQKNIRSPFNSISLPVYVNWTTNQHTLLVHV